MTISVGRHKLGNNNSLLGFVFFGHRRLPSTSPSLFGCPLRNRPRESALMNAQAEARAREPVT
jgi:hypothetical protein